MSVRPILASINYWTDRDKTGTTSLSPSQETKNFVVKEFLGVSRVSSPRRSVIAQVDWYDFYAAQCRVIRARYRRRVFIAV